MTACNDVVRLIPDFPEGYSNLFFNSDFAPYPEPRYDYLDPWAAVRELPPSWQITEGPGGSHGTVRFEPRGGFLDTGKLVIQGEASLFQSFRPLKFMPYDDEYREDEHTGVERLHPNHDIFRAVYLLCSGSADVKAEVASYGSAPPMETDYVSVELGADSEVDSRLRLPDSRLGALSSWRAHRIRYLDSPTDETVSLQSVRIVIRSSTELHISCIYLPGIDASLTGMLTLGNWYEVQLQQGEQRWNQGGEPGDVQPPPWAEALALRLGAYMVRTENKIDRLIGAVRASEPLRQAQRSRRQTGPGNRKKPARSSS
jgi:hypothetical protein